MAIIQSGVDTTLAVVKQPSTPAVATDPALVVAISPGTPVTVGVPQGSSTSGQTGLLVQGAVTTSAPTYVNGQTDPLSLNTTGDLRTAAKMQDGSGNSITSTGGALDVNIKSDSIQIDTGVVDESSFSYGAGVQQPVGGVYQDTSPNLAPGTTGALRLTEYRGLHVNLRDSSGAEISPATSANQTTANSSLSSIDSKLTTTNSDLSSILANQTNGTQQTTIVGTVPLPTNAATASNQSTMITDLGTLITNTTGLATSANQITANSSLASIDSKLTSPIAVTGPLTDTQLRATPVPVSGTVTANLGTIAGVATEATLSALNTKVTTTANGIKVDGSAVTQPVSATSLPLPTGAATAANQATEISSLSSIDTKLTTTNSSLSSIITNTTGLALDNTVKNTQGSVGAGTAASKSDLAGGVYNTLAPSLTNGQQAALQLDSSGRLITTTSAILSNDNNYGTVGVNTLRTAAQIGNATGAASFGAGTTSSQTLRVVLPTDQTAIPASQSGTWNINNISGTIALPTGASTSALQTTGNTSLSSIDGKLADNFGAATSALRTAAQLGNASGSADFGSGVTTGQTLRVVLPTDQPSLTVSSSAVTTSGSLTGSGTLVLNTNGKSTLLIDVTGTWTGYIQMEGRINSGTWEPFSAINIFLADGQNYSPLDTNALYQANVAGFTEVRLRANTITSGSATINMSAVEDASLITGIQSYVYVKQSSADNWNVGGVYTTALPTLTNGQKSSLQLDSSGRLITTTSATLSNDNNYGTVGTNTLRTAAQIGNATGAASFNAGTTNAQTLRVVLPTDQTAIPASQSGTWSVRNQDGSGNAITSTGGALDVNIKGDSIQIETGIADKSAFTYGTSVEQPVGGVYQDTSPALTAGTTGALRLTAQRGLHVNLRDSSGTEISPATAVAQASTTAGQTGTLMQGAVTTGFPIYTSGQTSPLSLTTVGELRINGTVIGPYADNADTVPTGSSGLIKAASELYSFNGTTWDRARGSIANGLLVDVSRIVAALPTGTNSIGQVTANAGTNLNTSLLALESGGNLASIKTNTDNLSLAQASTTAGQKGNLILSATTSAAPTYTTATSNPLSTTTAGDLRTVAKMQDGSGTSITSTSGSLNVNVTGGSTGGQQYADGAARGTATGNLMMGDDGTNIQSISVDTTGKLNINNISGTVSLPTGASTSALQTTGNTSLSSIDGKLNNNYGIATGALRTASQIGNTSGVADFNSGITTAQTLRVVLPTDQSAIPVSQSGTWNINNISGTVSLPTGAATSALQTTGNTSLSSIDTKLTSLTDGTQKSVVRGGAKGTTTASDVTSTASGANHQVLDVAIYDSSGNQITSFGGNEQHVQGDTYVSGTTKGVMSFGTVNSGAPTYVNQTTAPYSLDTNGNMRTLANGYVGYAAGSNWTTPSAVKGQSFPLALNQVGAAFVNFQGMNAAGSLNALNATGSMNVAGMNSVKIVIVPTGSPLVGTLIFEVSGDGGTWVTSNYTTDLTRNIQLGAAGTSTNTSGVFIVSLGDQSGSSSQAFAVRVRVSAFTSGQNICYLSADTKDAGSYTLSMGNVPSGSTDIGAPVKVGGIYNSSAPTFTTGQRGDLQINSSGSLKVDGSAVTQPVSASSLPLPTGAATSANQTTLGSQTTKINDGTNTAAVKASSTAPATTDPALVVAVSPNFGVSLNDGLKATYSASIVGLVPVASCTDLFTITGSASKTVRVSRITVTATQTTSGQIDVALIKRSTANSSGTSTSPTVIPHDSNSAAGSATIRAYTLNPTLGNTVGTMKARKVFVGSTVANSDEFITDFGVRNSQAIVLRGTSQVLSVNLNGVTITGGSFNISVEWTEE
jgi:hypothetical protein